MTEKPTTKEERKAMAALLADDEGMERRPGNEPTRILADHAAAKHKKKRKKKQ